MVCRGDIMKALVTGGTGFLGINLIKQLIKLNWQVTVLHRASSNLTDLQELDISYMEADLLDKNQLMAIIPDGIDAIFHLAGDTNMWRKNNHRQYQSNVVASRHIAEVAIAKKIGRFIHTSSIAAYGFHSRVIDESTPSTALISGVNYLKTKFLGEQAVKRLVSEQGLDAVFLNPCAIMGPFDRNNWSQLFTMIKQGTLPGVPPGEGSYCHVREVAAAHIAAYHQGRRGENYILAGADCSFLQVVAKIGELLQQPTPDKPLPAWILKVLGRVSYWRSLITNKEPDMTPEKALMVTERVIASSAKAVKELNYKDDVTIDEMLADCFNWMRSEKLI